MDRYVYNFISFMGGFGSLTRGRWLEMGELSVKDALVSSMYDSKGRSKLNANVGYSDLGCDESMDNIPFPPSKKTKVNYMWRDIERRAELYKIPVPNVPAPYPLQEFDRANLVGIVMNDKGLYLDYFKYTYEEWFLNGNEAGSDKNLDLTLKKLNFDVKKTIDEAELMESQYIENTKRALEFGIFGVPSFSFNNEIFWGDDRLEDAIQLISK